MQLKWALLATVALFPALAQAQSYNRVVTFGDSLSDNGNLFAVAGTPPAPYFQGRFSNGPTWVELLNGPMLRGITLTPGTNTSASNVNIAFGGARTDSVVALPPGTGTQISQFLLAGGKFASGDLVTLWGGANEFIQRMSLPVNPATIQGELTTIMSTAAGNIGTQVGALANAGAGTIVVVNLPDLGAAPAFSGSATGAQIGSFGSSVYNSAWATATAAAAAANPGANVIQVPVDRLFAAVIANPGQFGFTNVTSQCLTTPACVLAPAATQNQYLFWDSVHPTAAGHALMARFATEYIFAPSRVAAMAGLGETGLWARRQGMTDMIDRLSVASPGAKTEYFVSIIGEQGARDLARVNAGFANTGTTIASANSGRYAAGGLRIGGFAQINPAWTVGLGVSGTVGDGKSGNVGYTPINFAADLVARWQQGPTFINLGLGAQVSQYRDIERKTLLGIDNKSDATGQGLSAVAEAGYRFEAGAFGVVPKARLAYIWSRTSNFAETGLVAPVAFQGRTVEGLLGGGELRFEGKFGGTLAHALVGYDGFLSSSAGNLRGRLVANSARPMSISVADPVSPGLLLGVGLDATIGGWKAGAAYRATIGTKNQVTHRGNVTVSTSF